MLVMDMYFVVPTVTKVTSLEDDKIVLNVKETEEQTREIKKESGGDHQGKIQEEEQVEQYNEPSTSSGSKCPEVNCTFFLWSYVPSLLRPSSSLWVL